MKSFRRQKSRHMQIIYFVYRDTVTHSFAEYTHYKSTSVKSTCLNDFNSLTSYFDGLFFGLKSLRILCPIVSVLKHMGLLIYLYLHSHDIRLQ